MDSSFIRNMVLQWKNSGRLTVNNGQILVDGESVSNDPKYRDDGYSIETSLGCRQNKTINEYLDKLIKTGDQVQREVAAKYPRWFCFDPYSLGNYESMKDFIKDWVQGDASDQVFDIEAEDEAERTQARNASFEARVRSTFLAGNRGDISSSYQLRTDVNNDGIDEVTVSGNHRTVRGGPWPKAEVTERWPAAAISDIENKIRFARQPQWNRSTR